MTHNADYGGTLEAYVAGIISTFPPHDLAHLADCLPIAKAVVEAVRDWDYIQTLAPKRQVGDMSTDLDVLVGADGQATWRDGSPMFDPQTGKQI